MAVLEVNLPTGWRMDNLESLMYNIDDPAKRIKKIESNKQDTNIVFYFDTIKNDETCVKVPGMFLKFQFIYFFKCLLII